MLKNFRKLNSGATILCTISLTVCLLQGSWLDSPGCRSPDFSSSLKESYLLGNIKFGTWSHFIGLYVKDDGEEKVVIDRAGIRVFDSEKRTQFKEYA